MKIFLAIKSIDGLFGYHILGLYKTLDSAKEKCLIEPSFSKFGWIQYGDQYHWHNGGGLNVLIQESELQ